MYIQGVFFNWCPPKKPKFQPVSKFWHLELFWLDLLCNLTLRTFGGHQLKKNTLYFIQTVFIHPYLTVKFLLNDNCHQVEPKQRWRIQTVSAWWVTLWSRVGRWGSRQLFTESKFVSQKLSRTLFMSQYLLFLSQQTKICYPRLLLRQRERERTKITTPTESHCQFKLGTSFVLRQFEHCGCLNHRYLR